jgi:polyhydroxyalkanoate synthesis regulator phasin
MEIDQLVQRGYIPKEMAASLMQIPDVEGAYSAATAAYDYAQVVIERAAEKGEIEFEAATDLKGLFSEATRWLLRLSADDANVKYIDNLKKLIEAINTKLQEVEGPAPSPSEPPPAAISGPAPGMAGAPMGA